MWFANLSDPEEAGWFQETHSSPDKFGDNWAMTPTDKLQNPMGDQDLILLSTGGFAPCHDGHIAMMEAAKTHLESLGFRIRGGYVSPGHDDYVVKHKRISLYAPERLASVNDKLKDHPWIMVDPWEAIGCQCSVNYTRVIEHLEQLLGCRVCYVVGSDNARFSLAFQDRGLLCVVARSSDVLPNPKYRGKCYRSIAGHTGNIFWANNLSILGSSSQVRADMVAKQHRQKPLILRVDAASLPYLETLLNILKSYYSNIQVLRVSQQQLPRIPNLISLDQMLESDFGNLRISRNYIPGGYHRLGYTNRPGSAAIQTQLQMFTGQNVSLFDDDVATGNTMRKATSLLTEVGCQVTSYHTFSFTDEGKYEILDSRDFLPIPEGGLVVEGKRVPYIYPFVCPYVRASILPEQAEEFSDRIRQAFW